MTLRNAQKIAQDCLKNMPAIILGSGASAAQGIPTMLDLKNELVSKVGKLKMRESEKEEWNDLKQILNTLDLESALQKTNVSKELLDKIVFITWKLITKKDLKVFKEVVSDNRPLPLSRLYKYLFESTNLIISVITTNYDCLAEYAADIDGFDHYTGFRSGYIRKYNLFDHYVSIGQTKKNFKRQINIWKVHGSIDWFLKSNKYICLPHSIDWDESFSPQMITPGNEKYRLTQKDPFRDIIRMSDRDLSSAKAFLCIGYGFNDEHIQPKLVNGFLEDNKPVVIITKQLTEASKGFLKKTDQSKFLAIESDGSGSRIYTQENPEGFTDNSNLWDLNNFLDWATGK